MPTHGRNTSAYVQSAYRKPVKQKAAMSIKKTNCEIMARNDNTIKLFFNVTKANLRTTLLFNRLLDTR